MIEVAVIILAVTSIVAGALVFRVDSMARATYALAASFVAVGLLMLVLGAEYLAAITILMMIMEMAIMAVFMMMFMMNPAGLMPMSMLHGKKTALAIAVFTFVALSTVVLVVPWPSGRFDGGTDTTFALGMDLMGPHMLTMITVSAVIFATLVAAVSMAVTHGRYGKSDVPTPPLEQPPLEQERHGAMHEDMTKGHHQ